LRTAFTDLLVLLIPFAAISIAVIGVMWVLGPIGRAAKNRSYPVQFTLADFLCLFVLVQLALAGPAILLRRSNERNDPVTTACTLVAAIVGLMVLLWWSGVRTLSRAGIHNTFARAVTLTIAIPFGYGFSIALAVVPIAFFVSLAKEDGNFSIAGYLFLAELALVALVWALGLITRRIVAKAQPPSSDLPLSEPTSPASPPRSQT
jgi:hypothetical protein